MSAKVIKYVGRTTDFKGKTLWEILGSLKNFGVGRIVVRSVFERYPETSFMKIVKVETCPDEVSTFRFLTSKLLRLSLCNLLDSYFMQDVSYACDLFGGVRDPLSDQLAYWSEDTLN